MSEHTRRSRAHLEATRQSPRPGLEEVEPHLMRTQAAMPVPAEALQPPTEVHPRPQAPQAARKPKQQKKSARLGYSTLAWGGAVMTASTALLALMLAAGGYLYFQVAEAVLPNVRVAGVGLGGLTHDAAQLRLAEAWDYDQRLIIDDGTRTWEMPPAQFGLSLNVEASVQRALDHGHGADIFSEAGALLGSLFTPHDVEPVASLDAEAARAALQALEPEINRAPQDATVRLQDGALIGVAGVNGHRLDVERTVELIAADPARVLREGVLPLHLIAIPPQVADPAPLLEAARPLIDEALAITVYDPISNQGQTVTAEPATIAEWLSVQQGQVSIDPARLGAFLASIESSLPAEQSIDMQVGSQAVLQALETGGEAYITVVHPPTRYTVQPGQTLTAVSWEVGMPYWRIIEANPGINPDALGAGTVLTIPSKNDLLPLPVVPGKRIVVDISEQRAWRYQDGAQIEEYVISTGIDRSPTQPGVFQVQTHEINAYASLWDLTMPHFLGIYEAWPGFMNGFHGLPTLSGGALLWADVLGRPASYGCIILDLDDAEELYTWAEEGTIVEIRE